MKITHLSIYVFVGAALAALFVFVGAALAALFAAKAAPTIAPYVQVI